MKKCKHILVPCPNECEDEETKEVKQIKRMNLDNHKENECPKRAHECELCEEMGTFQHITGVHIQTCANVVVDCSNVKCNQRLQRRLLDEHVDNECDYIEIDCKVCEAKVERKNWGDHRQSDIHILHKKAARATTNVTELREEVNSLLVLLIITGVICAVSVQIALNASETSPESPQNSSMQSLNNSLTATLKEVKERVAMLEKQLAAVKQESPSAETAEKVAELEKQFAKITYMEDRIVEVEEKLAIKDGISYGTLQEMIDMKIEVFAEQRGLHTIRVDCKKYMYCNASFSFSEHHFKLEITVYPTTIDLNIRSQQIFTGKGTVVLLNQLEDKNHHIETVTFNNDTSIHIGTVKKTNPDICYFTDDTLYFKVKVVSANDKPWLNTFSKEPPSSKYEKPRADGANEKPRADGESGASENILPSNKPSSNMASNTHTNSKVFVITITVFMMLSLH